LLFLLFVGGCVAGFVNAIAGGGSALALPLLMMAGLDANTANGSNRLALLSTSSAIFRFHRQGIRPWGLLKDLLLPVLLGAILGAITAVLMPPFAMGRLFGLLFFSLAAWMIFKPKRSKKAKGDLKPKSLQGWLLLLLLGFYGGLFQAGMGLVMLMLFNQSFGYDFLESNVLKLALIFIYTLFALLIFQSVGQVAWLEGSILAVGSGLGSHIGAHVAIKSGERLVQRFVFLALVAAGFKSLLL